MENNGCESKFYEDLKNRLGFDKSLNDEEGKKILQKLYIDVLCKYEIDIKKTSQKPKGDNFYILNNLSSTEQKKESNFSFNKKYKWVYAEFKKIEDIEEQVTIIKEGKLFYYKEIKTYLKSNELAIFIDFDSKVKCIGSKNMKTKFKQYLEKLDEQLTLSSTKSHEKSIIKKNNQHIEELSENILKFEKNYSQIKNILHINLNKKTKVINQTNEFIKNNKLYLYIDKDIEVGKSTKNSSNYSQIELWQPQGDTIYLTEKNTCYFNQNNKRNRISSFFNKISKKEYDRTNKTLFQKNKDFQSEKICLCYKAKNNDDYISILYGLRNAVAHANIKLIANYLKFESISNGKVNLLARIHKNKICDFIDELNEKINNS